MKWQIFVDMQVVVCKQLNFDWLLSSFCRVMNPLTCNDISQSFGNYVENIVFSPKNNTTENEYRKKNVFGVLTQIKIGPVDGISSTGENVPQKRFLINTTRMHVGSVLPCLMALVGQEMWSHFMQKGRSLVVYISSCNNSTGHNKTEQHYII